MAELVGLLLGVTGPLQQVLQALEQLKERCDAVRCHEPRVATLLAEFSRLSRDIDAASNAKLGNLAASQQALVRGHLDNLSATLAECLFQLQETLEKVTSRRYRFSRAMKTNELFTSLEQTAFRCSSLTMQVTNLLATAEVP